MAPYVRGRGFERGLSVLFVGPVRFVVVVAAFSIGFLGSVLQPASTQNPLAVGYLVAALSISLALGKTTTACGLNVLASLWRSPHSRPMRLAEALVYGLVAMATAGCIGFVLSSVGSAIELPGGLLGAAPILSLLGLLELGIIKLPRILSLRWQVPAHWVRDPRVAPIVWGFFLGSGLSTWMPFPSYFGLLMIVMMMPIPMGTAIMTLYGVSRAAPALVLALSQGDVLDSIARRTWELRLLGHAVAGCVCLALSGAIIAVAL